MIKKHNDEVHIRFVRYVHELRVLELQEMLLVGGGIRVVAGCLSGTANILRRGSKNVNSRRRS